MDAPREGAPRTLPLPLGLGVTSPRPAMRSFVTNALAEVGCSDGSSCTFGLLLGCSGQNCVVHP